VLAAGALGFAACTLFAASRWVETYELRMQAAEHALEARNAAERYGRITASFPVTETTTENLRVAVLEFRRIADASAQPESVFVHLSRVLEQFPQMELEGVLWRLGRPGESREGERAAAAVPVSAESALSIEISGRMNATQRNDYRGITAQVQAFANALASGGYRLARTQLPFDVTSEGTLTGDIGAGRDSGEAPRFAITLVRGLP
jgi:hypothetical protein